MLWSDPSWSEEDPTEIVAAAVRQRGHQCDQPESPQPYPDHSAPDQKAWIIRCGNGTFRVTFKGDTGPEVEPLAE